ncbi:MAG: hypothetical protein IKH63_14635 [Prevotella sp.]|nr:hypothetical protein [Prevotella sp.]
MEKEYKRQFREQTPETKQKISAALKGRQKSSTHKANISKSMKIYWKDVPSKEKTGMEK